MKRRVLRLAALASLLLLPSASPASADNRALLIGVSGYAPSVGSLEGPRNDIQAMWRMLTGRGFVAANVRVLADGLPETVAREASVACAGGVSGAGCPTYANIVRALAELAAAAGPGDQIVVYVSGHGVQVPDLVRRDEPDGLTEAFVPIDVGRWNPKRLLVDNLLTDDTVGDAIERMRGKGAFVWAIFDTCHAGDMVRGAADYAVPRRIRGDALAIPDAAYAEARKPRPQLAARREKRSSPSLLKRGRADGLAGFYAAQSDQLALEFEFQDQDASGHTASRAMGAFTNALQRALAESPGATYRQLAQRIAEIYGELGPDMPAPYFEGDLDRPALSDRPAIAAWNARWQAARIVVDAGELDGLAEGALIALLDGDGAVPTTQVAGYAHVDRVALAHSEASPLAHAGRAAPIPHGRPLQARLEQHGIRAVLHVAMPPPGDRTASGASTALAALDALRATPPGSRPFALDWVEAGQPADVHLRLADGKVWLLSQFGEWRRIGAGRRSPSIAVTEPAQTADALLESLWLSARALNLWRLATRYRSPAAHGDGTAATSLKVEVFLYRAPAASAPGSDSVKCADPPVAPHAPPKGAVAISGENLPSLTHCDIVYVVLRNEGLQPIDVTLLYIDAEAHVQCFTAWGKARIAPLGTADEIRPRMQAIRIVAVDQRTRAPLPVGRERLMVIGVEKPARDPIETTFCHLAQQDIAAARGAASSPRGTLSAFERLMGQAGLAVEPTRGFVPVPERDAGGVAIRAFAWNVRDQKPR